MLSEKQKHKIISSFRSKSLKVQSMSKEGDVEWKPITSVHRASTLGESILSVKIGKSEAILTGGHGVFVSPKSVLDADTLFQGDSVQGISSTKKVSSVTTLSPRPFMYDVTVEDNHNLFLKKSGILVSNCPDRNYRFRPPTSEGTINQYNRVFSYIWEDAELVEYMERAVDYVNLWPPETHFYSIDKMIKAKPSWRQMILMGAIAHACMALALNWISEEFSLVYEEKLKVKLPSGQEVDLSIGELYDICYGDTVHPIKEAFLAGKLKVQAVDPTTKEVKDMVVSDVMQHNTSHKSIVQVVTESGRSVKCTEDHSLFKDIGNSIIPLQAGELRVGDSIVVVEAGVSCTEKVSSVIFLPPENHTYDICVPDYENFVLTNGILAHNSYSIGGISLDISKASNYESIKNNAESQLSKMLEAKTRTVKIIRGLKQDRYSVGLRSALGPHVGSGIMSPKNYLGI